MRRHTDAHPWRYADLDFFQREKAERVREGSTGSLILSELAPVITCGRRTAETDVPRDFPFAKWGIEIVRTERGGLATYHGPGQWVLFPVDRLDRLVGDPRGVRKAVSVLLELACEVGRKYDPSAEIRCGAELGVWTSRGKFAAVGIQISGGVLLHGLSVNGFATPTSFLGLKPCGLEAPVDFLLGRSSVSKDSETKLESAFQQLGAEILAAANRNLWAVF